MNDVIFSYYVASGWTGTALCGCRVAMPVSVVVGRQRAPAAHWLGGQACGGNAVWRLDSVAAEKGGVRFAVCISELLTGVKSAIYDCHVVHKSHTKLFVVRIV